MEEADLTFPVILSNDGRAMDGMHRVAKAWLLGRKTIRAVKFPRDPEPDETLPVPATLRQRDQRRRAQSKEISHA